MPNQEYGKTWSCHLDQEPKILINLHKHHTIVSISEGGRILLGYNEGDLIGRPLRTIQGPRTELKRLVALVDSIRRPSSCHSERLVFYGQDAGEVERIVYASAATFRGLPACVLHLLPCPVGGVAAPPPPDGAAPPSAQAAASPSTATKHLEVIQELDPEVGVPPFLNARGWDLQMQAIGISTRAR
jgi:hypothetical protein